MANDQEVLTRLAEAVADRRPVDWRSETDTPEGVKRQFQLIEALGAVHHMPAKLDSEESESAIEQLQTELGQPVADGLLRTWGHLRILERIGKGGFGEVYRAYDSLLDRDVALKLLRPEMCRDETNCRRFIQEARRQARVRHPNVVVMHGADRHEGRVGLWMELVKGQTLEERLKAQGPCSSEEAVLIGIEICRALAAVHNAGLIHRDVKTSNVMRQEGGQIVLMDFGAVSERTVLENRPPGGSMSGTPVFMAPEQLEGENASVASEIYSLGVLIYRLVTGSFPVEAIRFGALREKHRRRESKPLRDARADLPAAFVQAVDRALSPDAADRHASVGEFERALVSALGQPSPAPDPPVARPWWRHPVAAAALAVVALAVVLVFRERLFPPTVPFHIEPMMFHMGASGPDLLLENEMVALGDRLFMEIHGSTDAYVYVLNEDASGNIFVLFPLPGLDEQNPLSGGEEHRLPGNLGGAFQYWDVTSAGGEEMVLVIASRSPLDRLERKIEALPRAGEGEPLTAKPEEMRMVLRGIGGLKPGPAPERGDDKPSIAQILAGVSRDLGDQDAIRFWERRLTGEFGASAPEGS